MGTLYIGANPYQWVIRRLSDGMRRSHSVIIPTRLAARSLNIPNCQLKTLAYQSLQPHYHLVPRLKGQQLLRKAVGSFTPKDVEGTTRAWAPAIEELLWACPTLPEPAQVTSPRASRLIQVAKTYQTLLREEAWVDPHEAYWRSLELPLERRSLLIYGYMQPRVDELAFIEAIANEQSILVLPCPDHPDFKETQAIVERLAAKGWRIESEKASEPAEGLGHHLSEGFLSAAPVTHEGAKLYVYSNLEHEVRGTLAQIKELWVNQGVLPQEMAIVAQDEASYGDKLLDIAWEYDIPLCLLYDIPLNRTRLGAWLSLVLEVVEGGFPFEPTARLLSHPLSSDPDDDMWGNLWAYRLRDIAAWKEAVQSALGVDLAVLDFPVEATRAEWLQQMRQLLQAFAVKRKCHQWARESLAFSKLDRSWKEVATPTDEGLTRTAFFEELRELMAIAQVSAQPAKGGVELHSPTTMIGTRYRYLFVLGMAENTLPRSIHNNPVLDFHERKGLQDIGMAFSAAATLARQEAIAFYHLLQTATEQVVFSYNRISDRQERLPSPYLERLGLTETALPEFPIISLQELRKVVLQNGSYPLGEDAILTHARHAWKVEVRRESSAAPDERDGVTGVPIAWSERTFSVSQLTRLGLCPFSWFAQKVLKLDELPEEESSLNPGVRGSLYHRTLELLFKAAGGDRTQITHPQALRKAFERAEKDSEIDFSQLPAWEAQREEHLKTLGLVVREDSFYPDGAEAIALETFFTGRWKGFPIRGYIDRIDRTENGLVLIDYKTSSQAPSGVKDANGKAAIDLQLSVYKEAAAPVLYPDEPVTDAYYYSLTKGKKLKDLSKLPSDEELEAVATRCKSHLDQGDFSVSPDLENKACTYCPYDLVCRRGKRLDRKVGFASPSIPKTTPEVEA